MSIDAVFEFFGCSEDFKSGFWDGYNDNTAVFPQSKNYTHGYDVGMRHSRSDAE